jgi:hypothetical protein
VGVGTTVTVTLASPVPPGPVQVTLKLFVAVSAFVVRLPLVASAAGGVPGNPKPPVRVHEVASVLDHVRIVVSPVATVSGLADNVTVGGFGLTVTTTLASALPPSPVQLSPYVVVLVSAGVRKVPLVGFVPLQPSEAVQEVASVVDQVRREVWPERIDAGSAEIVTLGGFGVGSEETETTTLTLVLPPGPTQPNE